MFNSESAPPEMEIQALKEWYKNMQDVIDMNQKMILRLNDSYLDYKEEMIKESQNMIKDAQTIANVLKHNLKEKYNITV